MREACRPLLAGALLPQLDPLGLHTLLAPRARTPQASRSCRMVSRSAAWLTATPAGWGWGWGTTGCCSALEGATTLWASRLITCGLGAAEERATQAATSCVRRAPRDARRRAIGSSPFGGEVERRAAQPINRTSVATNSRPRPPKDAPSGCWSQRAAWPPEGASRRRGEGALLRRRSAARPNKSPPLRKTGRHGPERARPFSSCVRRSALLLLL